MTLFLVIFFVVLFWVFRRFSYEHRERTLLHKAKLNEVKNKLDVIAYKMEEKLYSEEFKLGTPCHDICFPVVNRTRYADKYFSISSLLRYLVPTYRQRVLKEIEEMNKEVQKMHPSMRRLYEEYQDALFEAFQIRHNVIFKILVVIFLLKYLPQIFKAVKSSQEIKPNVDWPKEILNFQVSA